MNILQKDPKKIIAIFDFCETLVDFQTADVFVNELFKRHFSLFGFIVNVVRKLLFVLHLSSGEVNKKLELLKVRGLTLRDLENYLPVFFEKKLIKGNISYSVDRLNWHLRNGHYVILVSAGYTPYLEYYASNYGVHKVIGTDIEIVNAKLSGFFKGLDCIGINKVKKINESIKLEDFDLLNSYCYSDSISDLPIFLLVGNRFLINSKEPFDTTKHFNLIQINTTDLQ